MIYLLLLGMAVLTGLIACGVARHLALRWRFLDQPASEEHKQHPVAVPYGGGVGMALAVVLCLGLAQYLWPAAVPVLPWLLIGCGGLLLLGLWDDWRPLPAWLKLLLQIVVIVTAVVVGDLRIDYVRHWPVLATALAIGWCLLITNAYNLLDHADGLSATIATISAAVLLCAAVRSGDEAMARTSLVLMGVLGGFLVWNWPPARLYMGDAGSLPLGFAIAGGCLHVTFWASGEPENPLALLAPLLVSAIPLYDTGVVIVKRARRRRPILSGDRNHISHRLARLGLSPRSSLVVAALLQTAIAGSALLLPHADEVTAPIIIGQACCVVIVAVLLEARRDRGQ